MEDWRDRRPYALLLDTVRPAEVAAVTMALHRSGIPFESGLLPGDPPRVLFWVPRERVTEARDVLSGTERAAAPPASPPTTRARRFPGRDLLAVGALVALHLAIVLWMASPLPPGRELLGAAGLTRGAVLLEPWRLITSLFVHSGPAHVLSNGLGLAVFAIPLLGALGWRRTSSIYLASGIGGGLAAVAFAPYGVTIIGSSGAVAGLFGAWLVLQWYEARFADLVGRHRIRTLGIGLLVLPSLLNPSTASGRPISIGSHIGGMLTGMAIGALLSLWRARAQAGSRFSTAPPAGASGRRPTRFGDDRPAPPP